MNGVFKLNAIRFALCAAFPAMFSSSSLAAEPFPALPVTLSTSMTPNIMLYIDTSGSMVQDSGNNWINLVGSITTIQRQWVCVGWRCSWQDVPVTTTGSLCNISDANWDSCMNSTTNGYHQLIDSPGTPGSQSYVTKMNIAKRVAKNLVAKNRNLRFGLFSFQNGNSNSTVGVTGGPRSQGAILRSPIADMSVDTNLTALNTAIDGLYGRTSTPLAEGLLEVTQYFRGGPSLYGVNGGANYVSPVQYRCQKNFTIVITDGTANDDQNLPGSGQAGSDGNAVIPSIAYTARDSSGKAVAENFSVCMRSDTVAADGYRVNCPATLDGSTTARTFTVGNITNMPSAIRDVAMYGNVADLRVGGDDADGKSFDDPKFAKQNMNTYTIGFSVNNPVLPAAALVGGGKYYRATDEATLSASLSNVVNSIVASTSNAGGLATTTPVKQGGNKLFQPVFNPDGWYGELRCYNYADVKYNEDGNIISGACSAPVAVFPTQRKIFSAKWEAPGTSASAAGSFELLANTATLAKMTKAQEDNLGSTDADRMDVIAFLRGVDNSKFRTRSNGLLGDIIDGQPLVVSAPSGGTSDRSYSTFQADNASRDIVFIGANDGMMHAFGPSGMIEIMAYVPAAVYPHLDDLTKMDYGASGGTPHVYGVNGKVQQADIKIGSPAAWKTIVVGGLAQGGQGFYALDATNNDTLAKAPMKWEWNDQNAKEMGYSFGVPLIYNVRTSAKTVVPAVILVNGYENDYDDTATGGQRKDPDTVCTRVVVDAGPPVVTSSCNTSALYIVNADTGALLKKISVPARADGIGGLSSPAGVDFGQDGILDYVYAGDMAGRLWRFDLTDADPNNFSVSSAPIFDAGTGQPIVLRPAVKPINDSDGKSRGNLILFGTGKLLTDADRKTKTTQSFYAVLDDMSASPTTVSKSNLLQRVVDDGVDATVSAGTSGYRSGTYRKIEDASVSLDLTSKTETKKGWYIDLPASSERLVSSPVLLDYTILFGTGIPLATEKCVAGGTGWVMGLNPLNGGVTTGSGDKPFSFVDIKLDNKSTVDDKLNFSTGSAYASGFATDGIPTELTYVADSSKIVTVDSSGGTLGDVGNVIALQDANIMAVYTGNAGDNVSKGNGMARPSSNEAAGGQLIVGKVGGASVDDVRKLGPGGGGGTKTYTIDTTIWREIK